MKIKLIRLITLIVLFTVITFTQPTFAQSGNITIGFGPSFCSSPDFTRPGFHIRGHYGLSDVIRAAADFNFYFPKKTVSFGNEETKTFWESNGNIHYIIDFHPFKLYGIGGANISSYKIKDNGWIVASGTVSKFGVGINAGTGFEFDLNNNMSLFSEVKYSVVTKGLSHYGLVMGLNIGLN